MLLVVYCWVIRKNVKIPSHVNFDITSHFVLSVNKLMATRTDAPFHLLLFCAAQNFVIILTVDIDILNNIKRQSTTYNHYWNERFQLRYQLVLPTPLPYRVQKLTLSFELIAEKLLKSTTSPRHVLSCTAQHFSPKVCA